MPIALARRFLQHDIGHGCHNIVFESLEDVVQDAAFYHMLWERRLEVSDLPSLTVSLYVVNTEDSLLDFLDFLRGFVFDDGRIRDRRPASRISTGSFDDVLVKKRFLCGLAKVMLLAEFYDRFNCCCSVTEPTDNHWKYLDGRPHPLLSLFLNDVKREQFGKDAAPRLNLCAFFRYIDPRFRQTFLELPLASATSDSSDTGTS